MLTFFSWATKFHSYWCFFCKIFKGLYKHFTLILLSQVLFYHDHYRLIIVIIFISVWLIKITLGKRAQVHTILEFSLINLFIHLFEFSFAGSNEMISLHECLHSLARQWKERRGGRRVSWSPLNGVVGIQSLL